MSKMSKGGQSFQNFSLRVSGQTQTNQSGDGSDGGGDGMVASVHPPPPPPPAPPPSTEPTIKVNWYSYGQTWSIGLILFAKLVFYMHEEDHDQLNREKGMEQPQKEQFFLRPLCYFLSLA